MLSVATGISLCTARSGSISELLEKLTTSYSVVIFSNMPSRNNDAAKARKLIDRRIILSETAFAELVLWQLPGMSSERPHGVKYRLALVVGGVCVMRFDNERGKGDHVHVGSAERPYLFRGVDQLVEDFMAEVKDWMNANRNS